MIRRIGLLLLVLLLVSCDKTEHADVALAGSGATFPAPLYDKWMQDYGRRTGVKISYRAHGSGAGIRAITIDEVDFAGSDVPMNDDELSQAGDVLHIPLTMSAVAVVYNLKGGPKKLRLTGEVLANIFLGKITKWNDPAIAALNSDADLPDAEIKPIVRKEKSGTTKVFTEFLAAKSSEFSKKVGSRKGVTWPRAASADGNKGIAEIVQRTPNTIGYVALTFARANHMDTALIKNRAGEFVAPSLDGVTAAAAAAAGNMPEDMRVSIVDATGEDSYPISSFSYAIVRKEPLNEDKGRETARFLWWAIHDGQKFAPFLHFATLPPNVVEKNEAKLRSMQFKGKKLLTE